MKVDMSSHGKTTELSSCSSEFLFAEYKALRAEILALEERGTNIQIAGLTGIPTLLAAGKYFNLSFLIIFGPVIVVVASLMIIFIQDSIMRDAKYIKDRIEPYFFGSGGGWENFLEEKCGEKQKHRRRVEEHTRKAVIIAFAFYYLGATTLACVSASKYGRPAALILTTIYGIVFIWACVFIFGNFPRGTDSASRTSSKLK